MKSQGKVSLCMIVKDEEANIERCLRSVKDVVDEIIIVDTGSQDATKELCLKYADLVLDYEWQNSFAAARNFGLGHATGDWILWLDADEELDCGESLRLSEWLAGRTEPLLLVELINYYGTAPAELNRSYSLAHHRLFRNHKGFCFKHAIHERLNAEEVMTADSLPTILPIRIHHYGYMDDAPGAERKSERNISLLRQEKERKDAHLNPWLDYHLASEYYRAQQYGETLRLLNEAIRCFIDLGQPPPSLVYKMKYAVLLAMGEVNSAWPAIDKAIELYPEYVDLHFYKGIILLTLDKAEEALAVFEHCIGLGDGCSLHLTLKGAGSFYSMYYAGQCLERLGDFGQAASSYASALHLNSRFAEAKEKLLAIERNQPGGVA